MSSQNSRLNAFSLILASFLAFTILGGGAVVLAQTGPSTAEDRINANLDSIQRRVSASTDDAEEWAMTQTVTLDNVDLEMVLDAAREQVVGIRFAELAIPQGVTITNAYVQFTVDESDGQPVTVTIQAEAIDNSLTFTSTLSNISSRARTAAQVTWAPPPWFTVLEAGPDQQTPNLAALIQEVIDRPGWTAGNAISLIITADGGLSRRTAIAYDQDPAAAPLLVVDYEAGPIVNLPPVVDAGEPQTIFLGANATLEGQVTDDGLPNPPGVVTSQWTMIDGSGDVTFTVASALTTAASFSLTGTYTLRLTADDGELTSTDDVTITVLSSDIGKLFLPRVAAD